MAGTKTKPLRLAVLISGSGTTLANLAERIDDGRLRGVEIALVISSRREVSGIKVAQEAGLPLKIIRKLDFTDEHIFSDALTDALDHAGVDLVVMGGFLCHWHLPARYQGRALNIHPALLPKYGGQGMYGPRVHAAVLAAGERESGCTVHLVDGQYDHGPIVQQTRVPIRADDTAETLARRVMQAERELYPQVLQQIADHGLEWLQSQV
ncbi:MAG: phosphoribosylglycinamide formyltransferase [Planctomycetota bacterium]